MNWKAPETIPEKGKGSLFIAVLKGDNTRVYVQGSYVYSDKMYVDLDFNCLEDFGKVAGWIYLSELEFPEVEPFKVKIFKSEESK